MKIHFNGLVPERRNSISNALELRLSCTNPSIWNCCQPPWGHVSSYLNPCSPLCRWEPINQIRGRCKGGPTTNKFLGRHEKCSNGWQSGRMVAMTCWPRLGEQASSENEIWEKENRPIAHIPMMHQFHIPQCTIQNRNVHISVLIGALWDMEQVHCGICGWGHLCIFFMLRCVLLRLRYQPIHPCCAGLIIYVCPWASKATLKNVVRY